MMQNDAFFAPSESSVTDISRTKVHLGLASRARHKNQEVDRLHCLRHHQHQHLEGCTSVTVSVTQSGVLQFPPQNIEEHHPVRERGGEIAR